MKSFIFIKLFNENLLFKINIQRLEYDKNVCYENKNELIYSFYFILVVDKDNNLLLEEIDK